MVSSLMVKFKGQKIEELECCRKSEQKQMMAEKELRQNRERRVTSAYPAILYEVLVQPVYARLALSQRICQCLKKA